jgi:hypothetical protein
MSDPSSSQFPVWVPFFSIGLWLFMSAFFALTSGWLSLASHFRAASRPEGQKVTSQVKQMGMVPEHRVTHLIISDHGLYLYASFLFRFLHPALLIPWNEVRLVREVKTLWWHTYQLDIGQITTLRVTRRAYEAMQRYVAPT